MDTDYRPPELNTNNTASPSLNLIDNADSTSDLPTNSGGASRTSAYSNESTRTRSNVALDACKEELTASAIVKDESVTSTILPARLIEPSERTNVHDRSDRSSLHLLRSAIASSVEHFIIEAAQQSFGDKEASRIAWNLGKKSGPF